jgi:hypothetical protein
MYLFYIDYYWTVSQHDIGFGYNYPGNWIKGTYIVDIIVDGVLVASDIFEIV